MLHHPKYDIGLGIIFLEKKHSVVYDEVYFGLRTKGFRIEEIV
jgi:hypothetical protein